MANEITRDRLLRKKSGGCLLVAFRSRPVLTLVEECPGDAFQIGDRYYRDKGYGDWTGFYDWLKDSAGRVLGVRYWPFEETHFLLELLSQFPYVVVAEDQSYLEIYFSSDCQVERQRADDQDFGANKVFSTDQGEWVISFDTMGLKLSDFRRQLKIDYPCT